MKIPKQLQVEDFNFIYLEGKNPEINGAGWNKQRHYYTEANDLLEKGLNYGVMCGYGGLIIIDADSNAVAKQVEKTLPETFTVKTGSGKKHYYYLCPEIEKKIILNGTPTPSLLEEGESHYGEVLTKGFQGVGPGSIHPITKKPYTVEKDIPIATVSKEEVTTALDPFLPHKKPIQLKQPSTFAPPLPLSFGSNNGKLKIEDLHISDITGLKETSLIEHPIHGATNGGNLHLDVEKDLWHCFRCGSGGNALSLLAVLEGVIECSEAVPGGLRGDLFFRTAEIAEKKYGISRETITPPPEPPTDFVKGPVRLSELKIPVYDNDWVWEGYLARRKITLLFATWKSGKSTFYNHLLKAIEKGEKFLGININFTESFVMSEEDLSEWVQRRDLYKYGKNIIIDSQPFVGRPSQEQWEKYLIEKGNYCLENKIDTVVIDTIANLWPVDDENNAAKVSEGLLPLRELTKRGLAVLLVHHPKKEVGDMDTAMRGSGALPSFVDAYMMMARVKGGSDYQRSLEVRGRSGFSTEKIVIELKDHKKPTERYERLGQAEELSDEKDKQLILDVLNNIPYPLTIKDLREEAKLLVDDHQARKITEKFVWRILRLLDEEDLIEREMGVYGKNGRSSDKYKLKNNDIAI